MGSKVTFSIETPLWSHLIRLILWKSRKYLREFLESASPLLIWKCLPSPYSGSQQENVVRCQWDLSKVLVFLRNTHSLRLYYNAISWPLAGLQAQKLAIRIFSTSSCMSAAVPICEPIFTMANISIGLGGKSFGSLQASQRPWNGMRRKSRKIRVERVWPHL